MTVLVKPTLATTQYGVEGSSPHRQGAGWESGRAPAGRSDNPAYAGKRSRPGGDPRTCADHPRMRGEETPAADHGPLPVGSPPHARGRGPRRGERAHRPRITPACAGKS